MRDRKSEHAGSSISVGDVEGTGIVIGHNSNASVTQFGPSVQGDVAALLDEFIQLFARYESTITDASGIHESMEAARVEVAAPSPRWPVVRGLLRGIAAGVTGVSALSEAIERIQALVAHFPT